MRVLITGVAGFIGSNLANRLIKENYEVIGIDDLSTGYIENLDLIIKSNRFEFYRGSVKDDLKKVIKKKVDLVIHLASKKIPRYSSAIKTIEDNILMTKNILSLCSETGSKLIFSSTSDVYGKNEQQFFSEDSNLVIGETNNKRWSYASSKIVSEQLITAYSLEFGFPYTIFRLFNSYGPNQNPTWLGGAQSVFIDNSIKQIPIEIHGNGNQIRTFTYVEDVIDAIMLIINQKSSDNQIFNIGSNPEDNISIFDLAYKIWGMVNNASEPKIKFIPYESFGKYEDVMSRKPDISKIRKLLGYSPKYTLDDGLVKTINWAMNTKKHRTL
ncbi:MAG TPA: NAD-dependent epimerase/dehydratase family protein [Vicingaceae bacterium]